MIAGFAIARHRFSDFNEFLESLSLYGVAIFDVNSSGDVMAVSTTHNQVVEINRVNIFYGHKQAIFDVTLSFPQRQVTALIGPSGCGKSTLLRAINRMNDLIDNVRSLGRGQRSSSRLRAKAFRRTNAAALHRPGDRCESRDHSDE